VFKIPGKTLKEKSNAIAVQNDSGAELHINYLFVQYLPPEGDQAPKK
jgi:hypothetical protein